MINFIIQSKNKHLLNKKVSMIRLKLVNNSARILENTIILNKIIQSQL